MGREVSARLRFNTLAARLCAALAALLTLAACTSGDEAPAASTASATTSAQTTPAQTTPSTSATASSAIAHAPTVAAGRTLATKLDVPWGVTFLRDGSALVAERPSGRIVKVADGRTTPVGTVPEVADQGEGGLLGLAFHAAGQGGSSGTLYAYHTSTNGQNVVVRMSFDGSRLGAPKNVLTGIASAFNHNGGLLKIGPDEKLWIGTGDAGVPARSQDRSSLNGKILRFNLDGSVPSDNPFSGSPVYSLGHRNVQGLAFDSQEHPWAIEFGQNQWDELNRIQPGKNYGWPEVEGKGGEAGFTDPAVEWPTSQASPSGMAIVDDVAYLGALRGERLWQVPLNPATGAVGTPKAWLRGQFGRIRNVVAAPGGGLWITTSNRDGRGDPGDNDDRIIAVTLGG